MHLYLKAHSAFKGKVRAAVGNKKAIRNKRLRKRENGNESKLEVMRHIEVTRDNEYIGETQLLAEQKTKKKF